MSESATSRTERFYNTLLSPVITEKSTLASERNQIVFRVPLEATKPQIAEAVEGLFKVKVAAVNTLRLKGKKKQFRGRKYTRTTIKKAIVTLEDGHAIDVTTGL
ncbi:MAG: 50S ribosomal protein L23 [Pseudomonadota bacterium]